MWPESLRKGKFNMRSIESTGGDFSKAPVFYFTPSLEGAQYYAQWARKLAPVNGCCVVQIVVPNSVLEGEKGGKTSSKLLDNLKGMTSKKHDVKKHDEAKDKASKTLVLTYPKRDWKEGILITRQTASEKVTRKLPEAQDVELIIADTSTGSAAAYDKLKGDWAKIDDSHVLWLPRPGPSKAEVKAMSPREQKIWDPKPKEKPYSPDEPRKLTQYIFWDEVRDRIEKQCAGSVKILHAEAKPAHELAPFSPTRYNEAKESLRKG